MSSRLLLVLLCLAAVSGCRKKSSPAYTDAEGRYSVLVARDGDDAFSEPAMDEIVALLQGVPADAIEAPKAQKLLADIAAERERIAREAAASAAAKASADSPPNSFPPPSAPIPAGPGPEQTPAAVRDAGPQIPTRPYTGIPEADFLKYWGNCVATSPSLTLPGSKIAGVCYAVRDDKRCNDLLGGGGNLTKIYIFEEGKLKGEATQEATRELLRVDAGVQTIRMEWDAGQMLLIPGAPLPPGFTGVPGAPLIDAK